MKGFKVLLGAVMVGTLAVGMINPIPGEAANAPAKVQPNNNVSMYGRMGMFMGSYFQGSMHEIIADKLGMTSEELYKARLDGKSIADLLEDKDISAEEVVKAVIAEREVVLNEMVKAKTITEAQKDLMLENMKAMVEDMIDVEGVGPGGTGAGYYRGGGCNMVPGAKPGMGRGRMGAGPMWW
jgi:hypothetical protein